NEQQGMVYKYSVKISERVDAMGINTSFKLRVFVTVIRFLIKIIFESNIAIYLKLTGYETIITKSAVARTIVYAIHGSRCAACCHGMVSAFWRNGIRSGQWYCR